MHKINLFTLFSPVIFAKNPKKNVNDFRYGLNWRVEATDLALPGVVGLDVPDVVLGHLVDGLLCN